MAIRTFIQQGQGYGSAPVTITAKIGGVTIYAGPVPTVDGSPPPGGNIEIPTPVSNLFSWTNDTSFAGEQDFEIIVDNGTLLMTSTVANYTNYLVGNVIMPGSETVYNGFWTEVIDGAVISDPFTNEKIDAVPQIEHPDPGALDGQWWWYINGGSVFSATLNVSVGNVAP